MALAPGAMVLVQTIWGLDQTMPVYPNMVITGPVLPPAEDLRERLAENHVELCKFLRSSESVVYVTTGSLAKLHEWQVKVIYEGLKKGRFRVVWSLKEDQQAHLPCKDHLSETSSGALNKRGRSGFLYQQVDATSRTATRSSREASDHALWLGRHFGISARV